MDRITGRLSDGTPYIKREDKRSGKKHIAIKTRMSEITETLARYEETGLTPEGINKLISSFARK